MCPCFGRIPLECLENFIFFCIGVIGKAFPEKAGPRPCPVEGCSGQEVTRKATRIHFWHQHVRDNMVILEEGKL